MNRSAYNISICAIFGALQLVFLICAKYIGMITLSFYVLASCAMMIPLTAKMYKESILTYFAVSALAFFIVGFPDCLVYITFSGAYTIFTVFCYEKRLSGFIAYPIKIIWANLVFYLFYIVISNFIKIDLSQYGIEQIEYYVFVLAVTILILAYDFLLIYLYKYLSTLAEKIFKK